MMSRKTKLTPGQHPYGAIEHRVVDSLAYADLSFSARSLLQLLVRQLTKTNNGTLIAAASYLGPYGFSDRTITRATKELISHGFVYRTRCGGYQKGASMYAVTWLSITRKEGLFLDGFVICAWRNWKAPEKNIPPANLLASNRKNGGRHKAAEAKSTARKDAKSTDTELVPVVGVDDEGGGRLHCERMRYRKPRYPISPFCFHLKSQFDRRRQSRLASLG